MTISPELEIQGWIVARLKADNSVMALIDGVYDKPPANRWDGPKQGYVSLGTTDTLDDGADCIEGLIHSIQVDIWSRKVGMVECKKICTAVKRSILGATVDLVENTISEVRVTQQRTLPDPDGLTSHGILTFEFQVEDLSNG